MPLTLNICGSVSTTLLCKYGYIPIVLKDFYFGAVVYQSIRGDCISILYIHLKEQSHLLGVGI